MATGRQIVADFVSTLGNTPGVTVTRSSVSKNVFEVDGRFSCLLYVKGRKEAPYTWGVTANVVERLNQQRQRWFTVLLYGSRNAGYFLSSADVVYYMQNVWPIAGDGDYKPAPGMYLSRNTPFTSFNEVLRLLNAQAS